MVVLSVAEDTVTEGMSVEVCLELFSRDLITGSASVTLVTDDTQVDLNEMVRVTDPQCI